MTSNTATDTAGVAGCVPSAPPGAAPVVRVREEHNISRRDIDPDALKVLYRLARNNFIAYLVGGGVRDLLLGRKPKDFDISTNAKPEQIRSLFRNCILIGRRFRLAHIRYGDKIIETSTFRSTPKTAVDPADPDADLFQRDDNLFGTPHEDALRRDFTVNGLFYDIESFSIIDYVGGMDDLAARRIRSIGDPNIRFREDPVRMIRAIRFASRLDFTLDPETEDAIVGHGEELTKASPARLLEEVTRLFAFSSGEKAIRLLHSTGLLRILLPEVADCLDSDTVDHGLFWRRLRALDNGDTVLPNATPALIFAVLLLDALKKSEGKAWTSADAPRLRYDKVHAFLEPLCVRLRFPRKLVDRVVHMYMSQHRFAAAAGGAQRGKRGSLSNFVTQDAFHESLALAELVVTSEGGDDSGLNHWRELLTERIYGREEGGGGHDRERSRRGGDAGRGGPDLEAGSDGGDDDERAVARPEEGRDGLPGRKLSRSARRRRNKRLRRVRGEAGDAAGTEAERDVNAAPAEENPDERPNDAGGQKRVPKPPPPADAGDGPEVEADGEVAKAASRGRRTRSRKKDDARVEPEKESPAPRAGSEKGAAKTARRGGAGAKARDGGAPGDDAPPPAPLTAAAFWRMDEPQNEPDPEPEKKKRGTRKKAAAKSAKAKDDSAAAEKPGPLPMDKADEADIPMHWLDEI